MDEDIISTAEAARTLGRSTSTVNRLVVDGKLTPVAAADGKTGARFYRRSDVEALVGTVPR